MNDLILSETFWRDLFIDIYPFLVYASHLFYPHAQTSSRLVRQGSGFTLFPTFVRCEFSFKNHPRSVSHMAPRPSERSPQPHLMQGAKRLSPKFCKAVERRAGGSFKQIGKRTEIGSRITNKRNKKESGIDMWIGFFFRGHCRADATIKLMWTRFERLIIPHLCESHRPTFRNQAELSEKKGTKPNKSNGCQTWCSVERYWR